MKSRKKKKNNNTPNNKKGREKYWCQKRDEIRKSHKLSIEKTTTMQTNVNEYK